MKNTIHQFVFLPILTAALFTGSAMRALASDAECQALENSVRPEYQLTTYEMRRADSLIALEYLDRGCGNFSQQQRIDARRLHQGRYHDAVAECKQSGGKGCQGQNTPDAQSPESTAVRQDKKQSPQSVGPRSKIADGIRPAFTDITPYYKSGYDEWIEKNVWRFHLSDYHFTPPKAEDGQEVWDSEAAVYGIGNSIAIDKLAMSKRRPNDMAGGCLRFGPSWAANDCNVPISIAYCQKFSSKYAVVGECELGHLATKALGAKRQVPLNMYSGNTGVPTEVMGCTLPALPTNLIYDPKSGRASGECGTPKNLLDAFYAQAIARGRWVTN